MRFPKPPKIIETTGVIHQWFPQSGWGFIACGRKMYHAHIAKFKGECACGHRHKCEIRVGARVKFATIVDSKDQRRYPDAIEIEVLPEEV